MKFTLLALKIILFGAYSCKSMTLMVSDKPKCFQLDKARDIPLKFLYEAVDAMESLRFYPILRK